MTEIKRLIDNGFISADFLKEEVRCDYLVTSSMKKAWAIQMDLLVKLIDVCLKHDLRIWVAGGSMLGAVRHNGFIPWDDDMDVFLPRNDYDKLMSLYNKEFDSPYFLQFDQSDPSYPFPYARIRNSNTCVNENVFEREDVTWNNGIFVDIFPLDGIGRSRFKLKTIDITLRLLRKLLYCYPKRLIFSQNRIMATISRIIHVILHVPIIHYRNDEIIRFMHRLSSYKKYDKADNVGLLLCTPYVLQKNIYSKVDYNDTVWLPFESIKVPVPKGWDNILRTTFGCYMQFPPKEKRGNWHLLEFDAEKPYKNNE